VRRRGNSVHDAQDLTQSFFAYLIEEKIYARVNRGKGKFRAFLLASLKNFLSDAYDRDHALKRGGGRICLPLLEHQAEEAESIFQSSMEVGEEKLGEDKIFEQNWAETLVTGALDRVRDDYKTVERRNLFENLQMFVSGGAGPLPTYDELAARLGIPASTLRSHVTRLRSDYREALRTEVRRTVNSESEVDGELRELLRVLKER
jgi:RNA polymerase sigma-70 factor (ECF subfamily)